LTKRTTDLELWAHPEQRFAAQDISFCPSLVVGVVSSILLKKISDKFVVVPHNLWHASGRLDSLLTLSWRRSLNKHEPAIIFHAALPAA
jgi:hypothetical protein